MMLETEQRKQELMMSTLMDGKDGLESHSITLVMGPVVKEKSTNTASRQRE